VKKIFLDTNVLLRFLLEDNNQAQACIELLTQIESGVYKPYTSSPVLLEIIYVLSKLYQIPKSKIITDVNEILKTRNLTLIENTSLSKAIELFQQNNIKLMDCVIALQVPPKCFLCSYDQEFKKLSFVKIVKPEELLN